MSKEIISISIELKIDIKELNFLSEKEKNDLFMVYYEKGTDSFIIEYEKIKILKNLEKNTSETIRKINKL